MMVKAVAMTVKAAALTAKLAAVTETEAAVYRRGCWFVSSVSDVRIMWNITMGMKMVNDEDGGW
jgi:hypothetical protein